MPSELWCYANRAPGWDAPEPADKFDGYRLFRPGHSTSRIERPPRNPDLRALS
ncbi:MAG: hypothetical protein ACLQVF_39450 [Isosphaeraceae bacterium]